MVMTVFLWIGEGLPARLVYAFLGHCRVIAMREQNED